MHRKYFNRLAKLECICISKTYVRFTLINANIFFLEKIIKFFYFYTYLRNRKAIFVKRKKNVAWYV